MALSQEASSPPPSAGAAGRFVLQVDVTSKTEGKVDNSHMLVKYDARLRDNVAVNVVQEVTDTVQVGSCCQSCWLGSGVLRSATGWCQGC